MRLWISRLFLMTGFILLLVHNIAAHDHNKNHAAGRQHHHTNALGAVSIDHLFSLQAHHTNGLQAIIPDLVFKPEYGFLAFPVLLSAQPLVLPDEPYPPGWITDYCILRGPPLSVKRLFSA